MHTRAHKNTYTHTLMRIICITHALFTRHRPHICVDDYYDYYYDGGAFLQRRPKWTTLALVLGCYGHLLLSWIGEMRTTSKTIDACVAALNRAWTMGDGVRCMQSDQTHFACQPEYVIDDRGLEEIIVFNKTIIKTAILYLDMLDT